MPRPAEPTVSPAAADGPTSDAAVAEARRLLDRPDVVRAVAHIRATDELTLGHQAELTGIPAPPFGEERRGARMAALMEEAGLAQVTRDEVGNVLAWYPHPGPGRRPVVVSAHLDTVFPEETDVTVTRDGARLRGPGISDDGRGLAVLLCLARAMRAGDIRLSRPLLVVATVGEEGVGDLRGVRHLMGPGGGGADASAFLSVDGAGLRRIIADGVGSRRWRVTLRGPGGHSWTDWGTANPIHALAGAIAALDRLSLPGGCTLSVGRVGGGSSVNAIPEQAWADMEVRGLDEANLDGLAADVRTHLEHAVDDANHARRSRTRGLTLNVESLGHRPGGRTHPSTALVRAAMAATTAVGHEPRLAAASTDANVAMSAGIPAVTLGGGGQAGKAHTLDEWYENQEGPEGVIRALLTVLLLETLDDDA